MLNKISVLTLCVLVTLAASKQYTTEQLKCHVCKAVVSELEDIVSKVDPTRKADVSGFRLDVNGNAVSKTVPLVKSEMYLTEVMEKVCDKMEDYLRATHKKTGKFQLLKIMVDGKMNPESSNVDFIQDEDLNKSLGHYCLEILEDSEEVFMKNFQASELSNHLDIKICSEDTDYCQDLPIQDDYEFDEKDEL